MILGPDRAVMETNAYSASLLDAPPTDIIGQRCFDLWQPKGCSSERCHLDESMCSGNRGAPTKPLKALDGYYTVTCTPLLDNDGVLERVILFAQNTAERAKSRSDRMALQARLQRSSRMESIGRLAGGVAHDFNNMLTAIICCSEILSSSIPEDDPNAEDVKEIQQAAHRAAELTGQLLTFSRSHMHQPRLIDLGDILASMEGLFRRVIGENIDLELEGAENLGLFKADRGQIEQVTMNLVLNARDAMPSGGRVTIKARNFLVDDWYSTLYDEVEKGTYVRLTISDTGAGIPPDIVSRIFEPFFTTKSEEMGSGLGLSVVYGIVTQAKGHIAVMSELGRGSTFDIIFPAVTAGVVDRPRPKSSPPPQAQRKETILVVEDDDWVRRATVRILKGGGYRTLSANNGKEARRVSSDFDGRIDLLLSDIMMPGEAGHIVARKIIEDRPGISVLFMSGYPISTITEKGGTCEDLNFLPKPFKSSALLKKVRSVLDQDRDSDGLSR